MNIIKFGVVIVTCNRLHLLKECINAVLNQTYPISCAVVVDNASTDGTYEYLEENVESEKIAVIHEKKNVGGAGGFSLALQKIVEKKPDWILIIDDDAIIRQDFLENIERHILINSNKYSAYSGVVLEEGIPSIFHRKIRIKKDTIGQAVDFSEYEKESFECDIASFCGLIINKELLDKYGFPKSEYFIWHDDTEFCIRVNQQTKILNVNNAVLDHKRKPGASDIHDWKNYYGLRNSLDILKKYNKKQYYKEIIKIVINLLKARKSHDVRLVEIYKAVLKDNFRGILGVNEHFLPDK